MEHDIYDSLRFIATTCEKMEDIQHKIAKTMEADERKCRNEKHV